MIRDQLSEYNPEMLFAEGFDEALIGVCRSAIGAVVAAYDYGWCVQILMDQNGWEIEEAIGWMEYNVISSYLGENSPVFIEGVEI